jgi:hypothetical protein
MSLRVATRHKDKEETMLLPHRLSDLQALVWANGTKISGRNNILSNFCDCVLSMVFLFLKNIRVFILKKIMFSSSI